MTILEKFNRAVIEAIHGLPYDEAILKEKENVTTNFPKSELIRIKAPNVTIGRVMQALGRKYANNKVVACNGDLIDMNGFPDIGEFGYWRLNNEDKQEATSEDQSEETLLKLLELLN